MSVIIDISGKVIANDLLVSLLEKGDYETVENILKNSDIKIENLFIDGWGEYDWFDYILIGGNKMREIGVYILELGDYWEDSHDVDLSDLTSSELLDVISELESFLDEANGELELRNW